MMDASTYLNLKIKETEGIIRSLTEYNRDKPNYTKEDIYYLQMVRLLNNLRYMLRDNFIECEANKNICAECGEVIVSRDMVTICSGEHPTFHSECLDLYKYKQEMKHVKPDIRPAIGENVKSRGVGYDLAVFVDTKQAGERVVDMFKSVIGKNCKTWLDYRKHEPNWIQVKIQKEDVNLKKMDKLLTSGVITTDIIKKCKIRLPPTS